ncbi:MAG: methyl-accepting chemotaxis protein [Muribaculaceae bacterium]|nr:methyl-accepting chemotaxis protein [Muribaculaceae bacterium]
MRKKEKNTPQQTPQKEEKVQKAVRKKKFDRKPKRTQRLQVKLIAAFLLPTILFIFTGLLIYSVSSSTLTKTYEDSANTSVGTLKEYFDLALENVKLMSTRLSVNADISNYYSGGSKQTESMLMNVKMAINNETIADEYVAHITIIAKSGTACMENGPVKGELYNAFLESAEGQYVEANMTNGDMWIDAHPSLDELTGVTTDDYALSFVSVLNSQTNKPVGYIIIDVKRDFVQQILDDAQIGQTSVRGLILSDGAQIVSGSENIKFAEQEFYQTSAGSSEEMGSQYVTCEGEENLYAYHKLDTNMMICALVPQKEIVAGANQILMYTIIAVVLCAFVAVILGSILAGGIAKTIHMINGALRRTSEGDLTGQVVTKRKDEFSILSSNLTETIKGVKKLILKVTHVSGYVSDSAEAVHANSQTLLEVTGHISGAVSDINAGIVQQSKDTQDCVNQMAELAEKITEMHQSANAINELTGETRRAVNEGMVIVKELEDRVEDSTSFTKDIITDIDSLNRESEAISGIIETINAIAEETNLLSLNASIEAARAGEAGRGFAVVSTEIRKLADQSGQAGTQIGEIITHIQERMMATMETAGKAERIVGVQAEALANTITIFEKINQKINELGDDVERIARSVGHIEVTQSDTMNAIESISATSSESEAASSELGNGTDRLLQAAKELTAAVEQLRENATELDTSVSIFKIE